MGAWYNEIDPFAANWLESLEKGGHIAQGTVDRRSIADLQPSDVAGHGQRHFFAGIGGWSYALRLAGWPDELDVWTGSCPCQPFSQAGRRRGTSDERHLWPVWRTLIDQCRPAIVFGEQVASADGRDWLASVRADMERMGYAVAAADLCAAGVGAPHARQRLYWVAYADRQRLQGLGIQLQPRRPQPESGQAGWGGEAGDRVGYANGDESRGIGGEVSRSKALNGRRGIGDEPEFSGGNGYWANHEWVECDDPTRGRVIRPVEPGTFPVANGVPSRVGRLRAYGNAIVPQVAAQFIQVFIETLTP